MPALPLHALTQPELLMDEPQDRLELDSRLTDLSRVSPWIEAVANRFLLGEELRFALHLCIEEALANVVLHGYRNEPGHPIIVAFSLAGSALAFTVEDQAPPFAPPDIPLADDPDRHSNPSLASLEPGGNGIRLLRHFAGSLAYERTAHGNRLTIGFPIAFE
jgi:serine/threonine-protein kinase RsbW